MIKNIQRDLERFEQMTKRGNVFIINSCFSRNFTQAMLTLDTAYHKIAKTSPSKNKPPKLVTQKSSVKSPL